MGNRGEVLAPDLEQNESAPAVLGSQGGRRKFTAGKFLARLLQRQEGIIGAHHTSRSDASIAL
jgi:hypothetical protein